MEELDVLRARLTELARRATGGGYFTFTDFLGLAEQSVFAEIKTRLGVKYKAFGGAEGAERVMIRFGSEEEIGYDQPFPIACLLVKPRSQKFAEKLSHRDFLGALMSLGIEREVLGDIAIFDNCGYVFVKEELCDFLIDSLVEVRRTPVVCSRCESIPEGELYRTEQRRIQISGERLDAVIARVFSLSREDAQGLFRRGLVFVNGRSVESPSHLPKESDKISVRTFGRFIYRGIEGTSRKGKLNVTIELYV